MKKILGPSVGYTDLLDAEIVDKLAKQQDKFFPLRPSSAGYCSRRLAYDLMEYYGFAKYEKEQQKPEVYRLLNLGHSVEYSALKNLELLSGFKIKYKQQAVTIFKLDDGPMIEGSIDGVLWSDNFKGVIDIKSQKDGHSVAYKSRWDETLEKYNNMESLERIGESAWYAEDLALLVEDLGDDFVVDNLLQLNLYASTEFMAERGIDHGLIYKYNKNTSQHYELRFKPSRELLEKVRDKFNLVYREVMNKTPENVPITCRQGSMRAAFCPYKCWGEDVLKQWFATLPPKQWATKVESIKGLSSLFDEYDLLDSTTKAMDDVEKKILDIMIDKKTLKVKTKDGKVYEARMYKSPKPHFELRRTKE